MARPPIAPTRFDRDTAVQDVGGGRYSIRIDPGWWIVRGPNGGYVAALLVNAMKASVDDPERGLRSLTIHYLRPPAEGPAEIHVSVERQGRSLTSVTARLVQDDKLQALAVAAFSKARESAELHHAVMPEVALPEDLPSRNANPAVPIHSMYDQRPALGAGPWSETLGTQALTGGWIRLAEPRALNDALIAALSDAWAPAIFAADLARPTQGVPTIDLTLHVLTTLPLATMQPDDHVLVIFRTLEAREGFLEEDGEIWSRDGTLIARCRQLAVMA
ncbi:MAG: thioesterase family protein [Deltaproteobacteria bacterium]|nr:thioesterase family protein [Deltaproteobacteria bacterium]MBW2394755.1 thioesterase family protein [Deltaproteobacteria bacterium]